VGSGQSVVGSGQWALENFSWIKSEKKCFSFKKESAIQRINILKLPTASANCQLPTANCQLTTGY
jgi:hypothetical protein